MDYQAIQKEQNNILAKIYDSPQVAETQQVTGMLPVLCECDDEDISFFTGCIGLRLKSFAQRIDLAHPHPDLFAMHQGCFATIDHPFNWLVCDLIKLAKFMRNDNWHLLITRSLSGGFFDNPDAEQVLDTIGASGSLLHIRFMTNRASREKLRAKKSLQHIGLKTILSLGPDPWDRIPASFLSYHRGSNSLESDIQKARIRKAYFLDLGLQSMAAEVQNSISKMMLDVVSSQYHGFNRITLQMTAAILCKMRGHYRAVEYQPYCVPLAHVYVPEKIKLLVDFMEEYPEISGHALFDNYWVVIPDLPYSLEIPSYFIDSQGIKHDYDNDNIVGALLGERDGEHYFICYWM